jgi:hypothetical protein
MERTLMVKNIDSHHEATNLVKYLVRLFRKGIKFKVTVSEPNKPRTSFFEKLGGLPPNWEDYQCTGAKRNNVRLDVERLESFAPTSATGEGANISDQG